MPCNGRKDLYHSYDNGINQPIFSVVVNGSNPDEQERFIEILDKEFEKVIEEGIDEKVLRAAINFFELVDRLRTDCYTMFNF